MVSMCLVLELGLKWNKFRIKSQNLGLSEKICGFFRNKKMAILDQNTLEFSQKLAKIKLKSSLKSPTFHKFQVSGRSDTIKQSLWVQAMQLDPFPWCDLQFRLSWSILAPNNSIGNGSTDFRLRFAKCPRSWNVSFLDHGMLVSWTTIAFQVAEILKKWPKISQNLQKIW